MVVSIQLNDEEKFQVLLLALALFLLASVASLCLALATCPLNRWLLGRSLKRKQRRQQQMLAGLPCSMQLHRNLVQQQQQQGHFHAHLGQHKTTAAPFMRPPADPNFMGPPPAYEAALRASRLQSLTGSCLVPEGQKWSPDWLKSALATSNTNTSDHFNYEEERQLDLGDYFHPPREFAGAEEQHVVLPMQTCGGESRPQSQGTRPPVMLRLWVKLMEPGELVQRARAHTEAAKQSRSDASQEAHEAGALRKLSLSRQLSIPHLFDSLMTTLASSKSSTAICEQAAPAGEPTAPAADERKSSSSEADAAREQQFSSLSSDTNSSSGNFEIGDECQRPSKHDERTQAEQPSKGAEVLTSPRSLAASKSAGFEPAGGGRSKRAAHELPDVYRTRRRQSIPPIASSITSRVLHMNVASFSYVKDEQLISTKKHNQLNFHHFYAPAHKMQPKRQAGGRDELNERKSRGKMCQLLVSICDIENLLNSSCLSSRACLRLAESSAIYIRCEILAPKSNNLSHTASRLLRNPLKALAHQQSSASSTSGAQQHATVDFGATIPASALEPPSSIQMVPNESKMGAEIKQQEAPEGQEEEGAESKGASQDEEQHVCLNWRHEPSADGRSIVVFNSIPKQIAQQQQLASATSGSGQCSSFASSQQQPDDSLRSTGSGRAPIDLIQFDSVFVSPILSRATLEQGHLRLRVYSQCKYVNETCLAELKLPLKQLMRTQTGDNLADAMAPVASRQSQQHQQQQAELILNNLLANLVTASTGSPLSTLIEQISAEAREEAGGNSAEQEQAVGSSNFLTSWLSSGSGAGGVNASGNLQRAASSLGAALNQLGELEESRTRAEPDEETEAESWRAECSKLIEQNYCRSLMVSHWLNYLVAPSYECQLLEESRAKLLLGITYLPTSNRLIFNAHRALLEPDNCHAADKQLVKRLRLQSDTSYLLRFMMLANGRVLKRKQTASARRPEWDSQEPVTFELMSAGVEQPSFVVCLVMRNSQAHASGSLQSLNNFYHHSRQQHSARPPKSPGGAVQSDPESLRHAGAAGLPRSQLERQLAPASKRDLVIGHLVLAEEVWLQLRSQPRRQIVKEFKLL